MRMTDKPRPTSLVIEIGKRDEEIKRLRDEVERLKAQNKWLADKLTDAALGEKEDD